MRALIISSAVLACSSASTNAAVLPFSVFENASGGSVVWQGQATVLEGSDFTIKLETINPTTGTTPSITQIYFRDTLDSIVSSLNIATEGPGVDFSGEDSGNLPGGNNIGFENGEFSFSVFDANQPPPKNGIGPGEFLTLSGALLTGKTFANLVDALSLGGIGVHVQGGCSTAADSSCSAILTPLPAGVWLLMSALAGLFGFRRWARRREVVA